MAIFSYVKLGKKIFGKQKTTGKTVNPFERKKMRSNRDAIMGGLKVDLAKLKGGAKKIQSTAEDVKAAMRDRARVKKMGGKKKIDPKNQPGLAKLKKKRPDVVAKMGYFKKGGRA